MSIDLFIFDVIVTTLKNNVFDVIMPILSDARYWRLPLGITVVCFAYFGKQKGIKTVLLVLIALGISDSVCGNILKPLIHRPRPLHGVTFSFPSCHASNLCAAATVIYYYWRKYSVAFSVYSIVLLVGYSRVYTTSHYPSDVLGGIFFGALVAGMVIAGYTFISKHMRKKMHHKDQGNPFS